MSEDVDLQRFVLPALLLVLFLGAFVIVITNGGGNPNNSNNPTGEISRSSGSSASSKPAPSGGSSGGGGGIKYATVKAGDTPSAIAAAAGISLDRLLELNPSLDPRTLRPGRKLKVGP